MKRQRAERHIMDTAVVPHSNADLYKQIGKTAEKLGTTIAGLAENAKEVEDLSIINEGISNATVQGMELTNQHRIENEGTPRDPQKQAEYNMKYKEIWTPPEGLSPQARAKWNQLSSKAQYQSRTDNVAWGIKQSAVNTENRANASIKTNIGVAYEDGKNGNLQSAKEKFTLSYFPLKDMITSALGEQKATEMMKDYESDFMKMYISGFAEKDPEGAKELLETEEVKRSINDPVIEQKLKVYASARRTEMDAYAKKQDDIRRDTVEMDLTTKALDPDYDFSFAELMEASSLEDSQGKPLISDATVRVLAHTEESKFDYDPIRDPKSFATVKTDFDSVANAKNSEEAFTNASKMRASVIESVRRGRMTRPRASKWVQQADQIAKAKEQGIELKGLRASQAVSKWFTTTMNKRGGTLTNKEKGMAMMDLNDNLMDKIDLNKSYTNEEVSDISRELWNSQVIQNYPEVLGAGGVPNKIATKDGGVVSVSDTPDDVKADIEYKPKPTLFRVKIKTPNGSVTYREIDENMKQLISEKEGYEIVG